MNIKIFYNLILLTLIAMIIGCTNSTLYAPVVDNEELIDNKLKIQVDQFCTENPDEVIFPVKIMFIIDCSSSMNVSDRIDPITLLSGRSNAVKEVVDQYIGQKGVEFSLVKFSGESNILTQYDTNGDNLGDADGFTNIPAEIYAAIGELESLSTTTDYEGALSLAYELLVTDMMQINEDKLARSKYILIFLSDGLPNPVSSNHNTDERILKVVNDLMEIGKENKIDELKLHTAYLSSPTISQNASSKAISLLKSISEQGEGTFRNFSNNEEINFLYVNYTSLKRMYTIKSLIVSNMNARPVSDKVSVDSDMDGLADINEYELGTDSSVSDTDDDGFSDFLEYSLRNSGFDPLDPDDADCLTEFDRRDSDGDMLKDCEERFIGTSPYLFDSDADGIPDGIEYRYNTNPVKNDVLSDIDFDSASNISELRIHTNPVVNDSANASNLAYRYNIQSKGIIDASECYSFTVENISLNTTQLSNNPDNNGFNNVLISISQVLFNNPDDFGIFRIACVKAKYIKDNNIKIPFSGLIKLEQSHFKKPEELNLDEDCINE